MRFVSDLTTIVSPEGGEIRICNTICEPTYERQNALKVLASQVDLILAIGGKKSSNTARLAEVGNQMGVTSYHIERAEEIDTSWLDDVDKVGITAGASTPDDVIQSVVDHLTFYGYERPAIDLLAASREAVPAY
jgi:4-hydroxy-3-methylbut-2-enyl diphosphate reductase